MTWFGGRQAAEKAKRAVRSKTRRARELAARPAGETGVDLDELYAIANGICALCKLPCPRSQASVEHKTPLVEGGADTMDNAQLAHRRCNSKKGARTAPRKKGLRRTRWKPKPRPTLAGPEDF